MSNLNTNFESNDFDNFLNLDNDYTPVSASSANNQISSLSHQSSASSSSTFASAQPAFSGPTHQYDSHRQQTGLPVGGLASTFAVNQASGLHSRPGNFGFVMPTETLNIPLSNLDDFDFGKSQYLDMNDMDFDADSPSDVPAMFYPPGSSQIKTEPSQSTPIQRIYPGMHSQQAAQAKAAQAQKQQEMLRQQQQKQIAGQLPLPTQAPKGAKDPLVEESISRLLSRMRQSSTSSVDEAAAASAGGISSIPRPKKDEDDMDEDERLLASEEGKKLSSKERRQLRNKVSARAFRSRRKEYIGQLEGEVAAKAQEANDLRLQNQQLMEENTRLTDLTRMLLSSQAFSGFLQELSNSGASMPSAVTQQMQQPQASQQRKDVPAHEAARQLQNQNQQQVGMTLIPETQMDATDFSNSWNVPLPSSDFQVFSMTVMPEPVIDTAVLLEKSSSIPFATPFSKKEVPELSTLPTLVGAEVRGEDIEVDDIGADASDLYAANSVCNSISQHSASTLIASLSKPNSSVQSHTSLNVEDEVALSSRLEKMCSKIEEDCARLEAFLP